MSAADMGLAARALAEETRRRQIEINNAALAAEAARTEAERIRNGGQS